MSYQVHNFQTGEIIEAFPVNEMDAQIQLNETNINQKLNHNQGASNVGKFMVVDTDGELVPGEVDLSMKADKPSNPTNGDLAALDANGNLVDSGKKTSDFLGTETIDDTAGVGDDDLVWSADKLASEFRDVNAQKANTDSVSVLKEINGGSIVTVDDGIPEKVKVIDIEIAPKQDLNGYDKPWIGGAGKNLFYLSSSYATQGTVTYSPNPATGELTLGGSAPSSQANRNLREISVSEGEKYFISGTPANGSLTTSCVRYVFRDSPNGNPVGYVTDVDSNGVVVTVPEGATILSMYSHTTSGTDPNGIVLKPFVAKSEVALPFEPYENICPISGWTKCKVARTGKNMADPDSLLSERIINESGGLNNNSDHKALVGMIPVKPLTTYTLSGKDMHVRASGSSSKSNAFVMVAEYAEGNWQSYISRTINSQSSDNSYTFTTSEKTYFVRFSTGIGATDIQFELGSFATTYTEYTGNFIYSIVLPDEAGTVYGGELSIFRGGAGMLEVDRKVLNITGENVTSTLNGGAGFYRAVLTIPDDSIVSNDGNVLTGKLLSDQYVEITNTAGNQGGTGLTYRGNGSHSIILSNPQVNSSAIADWKNWIDSHPFTIVYGLGITSFYSQFPTPAVEMVFGTNNIFADTGEIKQMTYPAERYFPAEQAEKERIHVTVDEPSDVITINDGADNVPMALKVAVEPVQDLHGYDYPWAGGRGKNLISDGTDINNGYLSGYRLENTGEAVASTSLDVSEYFPVTANETYTFSQTIGNLNYCAICFYDSSKNYISGEYYSQRMSFQITAPATAVYARATYANSIGIATYGYQQFEKGNTASTWSPYSNICPVSGWTGANITRTGKNLLNNLEYIPNKGINAEGDIVNANNARLYDMIPIQNGKCVVSTVRLSTSTQNRIRVGTYDANKVFIERLLSDSVSEGQITKVVVNNSNVKYVRVCIFPATESDTQLQVELGTERTNYEPFGRTYPIAFPSSAGTVYGGELTVNKDGTGELVVNKKCIAGNEVTWVKHGTYNCFSSNSSSLTDKKPGTGYISGTGELDGSLASDSYAVRYETLAGLSNGTIRGHSSQTTVYIRDDRFVDATSFNEYASNFNVCYELAEPIVYSFNAQQVRSILGINNIFADTGKINEVQYSADTKLYIESTQEPLKHDIDTLFEDDEYTRVMIAHREPSTAIDDHDVGDLIVHAMSLYKVIDSIESGERLIVGENIRATTIADELAEIKEQIANILPGTGVSF